MVTALACLTDCLDNKKYSAALLVAGWFSGRFLVAECGDDDCEILAVGISYPSDRDDGASALKGPADRLARYLDEIEMRGDESEQLWLDECKHRFTEVLCGLALADAARLQRAVQRLGATDPQWPEIIALLSDRLETYAVTQARKIDHDPLPQRMSSLFAALIIGTRKLKTES